MSLENKSTKSGEKRPTPDETLQGIREAMEKVAVARKALLDDGREVQMPGASGGGVVRRGRGRRRRSI